MNIRDTKFRFRHNFIKFLLSALIIINLISVADIYAFSAEKVSFRLQDCTTDNNRLFTVDMLADCSSTISAASFEFTYDKDMFEFRDAKVTDDESKIAFNELDNKVKVVYLYTNGKNINDGISIFTLTFKSVKEGTGYIDFSVSDCVSGDIKPLDAGNCTSAKITVNSKSISKSESGSKSDNNSKTGGSGKSSKKEETKASDATIDEIGMLNPINNADTRMMIIGIAFGASAIIIAMLAYNIFNKIKAKKKNNSSE